MNAPVADIQWFDFASVRASGRGPAVRARLLSALAMPPAFATIALFILAVKGAEPGVFVWPTAVLLISALAWWWSRRRPAAGPDAVDLVGVGPDGIHCVLAGRTELVGWDRLAGVRVHSTIWTIYRTVTSSHYYLDLIVSDPLSQGSCRRFELAEDLSNAGPRTHRLALGVAIAVRARRPWLWQGFTVDDGGGTIRSVAR